MTSAESFDSIFTTVPAGGRTSADIMMLHVSYDFRYNNFICIIRFRQLLELSIANKKITLVRTTKCNVFIAYMSTSKKFNKSFRDEYKTYHTLCLGTATMLLYDPSLFSTRILSSLMSVLYT